MSDDLTPQNLQPSRLELLRAEIQAGFQSMDKRIEEQARSFESLDARVTTEAEAIRRHFDVVAEGLRDSFKYAID